METYPVPQDLFTITAIILYGLYRLVKFLVIRWRKCKTLRAIAAKAECLGVPAEASGAGNIINISTKTINESLARSSEVIPLRDIDDRSERERAIQTSGEPNEGKLVNPTFKGTIKVLIGPYFKGGRYCVW
jgi:hypothetical protein